MLVLRKDLKEGIGCQIRADLLEVNPRPRFAFDPQADSGNLVSPLDDDLGEIELAIKFESARVDGECAGRHARLGSLVDDAWFCSELGQPERENQACGPGADDQYVAARHVLLLRILTA